eukprot:3240276-Prymnesium_polylepis.1
MCDTRQRQRVRCIASRLSTHVSHLSALRSRRRPGHGPGAGPDTCAQHDTRATIYTSVYHAHGLQPLGPRTSRSPVVSPHTHTLNVNRTI